MNQEEMIRDVRKRLFEMQDTGYRDFHARLVPTVEKEKIIGIRTPILRKFAKEFGKTERSEMFLKVLPHQYYEENNLHGLLIEQIRDYDKCLKELECFLPHIDNWATCDLLTLHLMKKHRDIFFRADRCHFLRIFRFKSFVQIMAHQHTDPEPDSIGLIRFHPAIRSEEYYVNMMRAWYFATALAKQYEKILPFLEEQRMDIWTHNKTIQKSIESYRITQEQKDHLRTLRIKK